MYCFFCYAECGFLSGPPDAYDTAIRSNSQASLWHGVTEMFWSFVGRWGFTLWPREVYLSTSQVTGYGVLRSTTHRVGYSGRHDDSFADLPDCIIGIPAKEYARALRLPSVDQVCAAPGCTSLVATLHIRCWFGVVRPSSNSSRPAGVRAQIVYFARSHSGHFVVFCWLFELKKTNFCFKKQKLHCFGYGYSRGRKYAFRKTGYCFKHRFILREY